MIFNPESKNPLKTQSTDYKFWAYELQFFVNCNWVKATTLDVPQNIFLSWGSSKGELAVEEDFVQFWRYKIATDFTEKRIETVAAEVLT